MSSLQLSIMNAEKFGFEHMNTSCSSKIRYYGSYRYNAYYHHCGFYCYYGYNDHGISVVALVSLRPKSFLHLPLCYNWL
jgi:hypothetical protein